ncbi:MAG: V-type ATP synthase subunit D [Candidatus Hadarchaeota archaeon]
MALALTVSPTRMELMKLRRRISLAKKGHDLLKEKMDALVMEFFGVLGRIQEARAKSLQQLSTAHRALVKCLAAMGTLETAEAAREARKGARMEISTRFIMGIQVPRLEAGKIERSVIERGYDIQMTSSRLDAAAREFESALKSLVALAELEASAYAIAGELEKTKRRVNALEYIIIPGLRSSLKFILMRLDEMERENFTRLKRIKAMLEKRD